MFGISAIEFGVILILAVLFVGPKQLPDVLRVIGKIYRNLNQFIKNASQVIDDTLYDSEFLANKTEEKLSKLDKSKGDIDDK